MASDAMSSGELPLPATGIRSIDAGGMLPESAPIHELAEEIVRAALELDTAHPDAARIRALVTAIAHPSQAHPGMFGPVSPASLASEWTRAAALVAGMVMFLVVGGMAWLAAFPAVRTSTPRAVEARAVEARTVTAAPAPSPSLVPALLATAFQDQVAGHSEQATAAYLEVLKEDPGNRTAKYNLGVIDQAANRNTEAEEHYRDVLASDPAFVPALFNLAILRTAAGASAEAVGLYQRILTTEPGSAPAHLNLGILLVQSGDREGGTSHLRRAVALDPALAWRVPAE